MHTQIQKPFLHFTLFGSFDMQYMLKILISHLAHHTCIQIYTDTCTHTDTVILFTFYFLAHLTYRYTQTHAHIQIQISFLHFTLFGSFDIHTDINVHRHMHTQIQKPFLHFTLFGSCMSNEPKSVECKKDICLCMCTCVCVYLYACVVCQM